MDHLLIKGVVTKDFNEYIDVFVKIFLDDFINFDEMSTHIMKFNKCFVKCRKFGASFNLDKQCAHFLSILKIFEWIVECQIAWEEINN
jgi:hypothetical protein